MGCITCIITACFLVVLFSESTVPSMPTSLRVRPLTNSIIVSWTPPVEDNILVRGYILGYGIGLPDVYKQVLEAKDRMHTIINLRECKNSTWL